MKVVFSDVAYSSLLAETYEKIRTETGGVFLGCYHDNTWYIIETVDPGPKSVFRQDYFEYDQPYTSHLINKRARLYSHPLTLIGLWHRHPGSFDIFSSTDDGTNATYAKLKPEGAISILVNIDPVFRLSVFHVGLNASGRAIYTQLQYIVGDNEIPKEYRSFRKADDILQHIDSRGIRSIGMRHYVSEKVRLLDEASVHPVSEANVIYLYPQNGQDEHTLQECEESNAEGENNKDLLIDAVIDDIAYLSDVIGFKTSAVWNKDMLDIMEDKPNGEREHTFSFTWLESQNRCAICFEGKLYLFQKGIFSLKKNRLPPLASARNSVHNPESGAVLSEPSKLETDITQAYTSIKNCVYRVLRTLLNNDEKGRE